MIDYRDCIIVDDPSIRAKAHMARMEKSRKLRASAPPHPAAPDAWKVLTLCEVCAKAAGGQGGCSWSRKGEQQPVPGWDAVRRDVSCGVFYRWKEDSYVVLRCPEFVMDKHRREEFRQFDPERVRRRAMRNGGRME